MDMMPSTPISSDDAEKLATKQPQMEAWWRDDFEFFTRYESTPRTLPKSDLVATSVSSVDKQPSLHTTASVPTPKCSSWTDTPTRKAVSASITPATGSRNAGFNRNRDVALQFRKVGHGLKFSQDQQSSIEEFSKRIDHSHIDSATKDFVKAALEFRLAKGDTIRSLEYNVETVLESLGDDVSLNSVIATGLFCSDMTAILTSSTHDVGKLKAAIQKLPYKLRPDRYSQKLTDDNAQGVFPPDACVFVGNLHKEEADLKLRSLVFSTMSHYGDCNVRLTRDSNNVPTAFVQFWDVDSARRAISDANNVRPISGRVPRIEQARVQRELYVCNEDRSAMPMGKIRDLMKDQGPYNSVNYPTVNAVQNRGLPCNGVVVEFCTFGDYNDTHKSNFNAARGIFTFPWPEEAVRKPRSSDLKQGRQQITVPENRPVPIVGSFDARSVFVGNLHRNVTHFELKTLFSEAGAVVNIHMAKHPSKRGNMATYAFVEFAHPTAVWLAILVCDGHIHRGFPMRVQMRRNIFTGNFAAAQTLFHNVPDAYGQPAVLSYLNSGGTPLVVPSHLMPSPVDLPLQGMHSAWYPLPTA